MNVNANDPVPVVSASRFGWRTRRDLLALAPVAALAGLASTGLRTRLLTKGLQFSDRMSEVIFQPSVMVQTFRDSQLTPLAQFPYNSFNNDEPDINFDSWSLLVEGEVSRPGPYSLAVIRQLPKQVQNVRHVCIEGWSVVGQFGGVRFGDFLDHVGANPAALYVKVLCYDDYYSSYDIASCRHPQSLLCYEMYGRPLDRGHGTPLRVHMPTKLGYKSAKYLFSLEVRSKLPRQTGFWEDQGYSWHGGI